MFLGSLFPSNYDVVIVGAGPAGCIAAKTLSRDYKTLLIDWSRIPRDKPCGGLLVEESIDFVKKLDISESVFSSPKTVNMKYLDWNNGLEKNQSRGFLNISRKEFDHWLLKMAKDNCRISSNTKFINFDENSESVNVLIEKDSRKRIIKTKYLIAADGALSFIRRRFANRDIRYYFAVQEWVKHSEMEDFVFILDNDVTDFYSWLISKGEYLVMGSAIQRNTNLNERFELLKKKLKEKMNIDVKHAKREGSIIARPSSINDIILGNDRVMLVGEAAGLISPSTGEGISFALRSGHACAKALNEDFSAASDKYKELCEQLVEEIKDKLKKANMLSSVERRREFMVA